MRRLRPKAFTLIEVIGSVAILGVAIVGVLLCGANGLAASRQIEQKVKSALLAGSQVEQIKGSLKQDFDQVWASSQSDLGENFFSLTSSALVSGRPDLKLIQASVGYDTNGDGTLDLDEIKVTLTTQVAEQG